MKRIRIKDIAAMCGFSTSTVARYLNGSGYISKEKAVILDKVISEIGYTPNKNAQNLRGSLSETIGCIVPGSFPNAFFSQISMAIEKKVTEKGYQFLTYTHDGTQSSEQKYVEELISRDADYIIYLSQFSEIDLSTVKKLDIPIILIKRGASSESVHKILMNEQKSTELAIRYLIEKKHKKIGYIGLDFSPSSGADNLNIYKKLMTDTFGPDRELYCDVAYENSVASGFELAKKVIGSSNKPTAIYVASDILACGVMQYLYLNRIRVPEDISVIGYGDTLSGLLAPQLTTVSFTYEDIASAVIQILKDHKKDEEMMNFTIQPKLIERASVRTEGL